MLAGHGARGMKYFLKCRFYKLFRRVPPVRTKYYLPRMGGDTALKFNSCMQQFVHHLQVNYILFSFHFKDCRKKRVDIFCLFIYFFYPLRVIILHPKRGIIYYYKLSKRATDQGLLLYAPLAQASRPVSSGYLFYTCKTFNLNYITEIK